MKYAWIEKNKLLWPVCAQCRVLRVSASGYRQHRARRKKILTRRHGGGLGRIMKLGFQPVSLTAQFYGNAVHPAGTSSWTTRLQISFLFPKLTKEQQMMMMEMKIKQMQEQEKRSTPTKD